MALRQRDWQARGRLAEGLIRMERDHVLAGCDPGMNVPQTVILSRPSRRHSALEQGPWPYPQANRQAERRDPRHSDRQARLPAPVASDDPAACRGRRGLDLRRAPPRRSAARRRRRACKRARISQRHGAHNPCPNVQLLSGRHAARQRLSRLPQTRSPLDRYSTHLRVIRGRPGCRAQRRVMLDAVRPLGRS